jgi:ATP-dependent helicase/nuclease subunit B
MIGLGGISMTLVTTEHGSAAYDALREAVRAAKAANPLRTVTLLVPSELVGVTARRTLAHGLSADQPGIAGLAVLTLRRLAEQLAGADLARTGRTPLTDPLLAAAIRDVLAAEPGIFAPVAEHPGTVQAIASAHRELRTLPTDSIEPLAAHSTLSGEVVRIHQRVRVTTEERFFDAVDLLTAATGHATDAAVSRLGAVLVLLPHDLDPAEQKLLRAVLTRASDPTVILAFTGDVRADAVAQQFAASIGALDAGAGITTPRLGDRVLVATDGRRGPHRRAPDRHLASGTSRQPDRRALRQRGALRAAGQRAPHCS